MEVLPITSLHQEDFPYVSADLIRLGQLARSGFPVANGIVVLPPEIHLKTTLERFEFHNKEVFEQKLDIIKSELRKIPIPNQLVNIAKEKEIDGKLLWIHLLDQWMDEIRSGIWREGLTQDLLTFLNAQPVFFTTHIEISGKAHTQYPEHQVVIELTHGLLNVTLESELQELVKKGDRLLGLHYCFEWIVEMEKKKRVVKIVKIIPYTPSNDHLRSSPNSPYSPSGVPTEAFIHSVKKTAVKVLFSPTKYDQSWESADGLVVFGERFTDFDQKAQASSHASDSGLLMYKLTDLQDHHQGIRGTLRLLHQDSLLSPDLQAFLFMQHTQKISEMGMILPFVRSVFELSEMKRKLHNLGFKRSGKLKLWMEVATTENIINLRRYCEEGLDGIFLNLDELSLWVGGMVGVDEERMYYHDQVEAALSLLDQAFKIVHQLKIPVIVSGSLVTRGDVMHYLLKKGVWGVVFDSSAIYGAQEYIQQAEKKLIKQALAE